MKYRILRIVITGILATFVIVCLAWAYPTIFPTGTTIYKPSECYNSYILIADHASLGNHPTAEIRAKSQIPGDIRLIDMNGTVVHTWNVKPNFNKRCRLLPDGHLLYVGPDKTIIEYDWEGRVVWVHEGIDSINDMRWLPNNNRLFLDHEPLPAEYQKRVKDVEVAGLLPPIHVREQVVKHDPGPRLEVPVETCSEHLHAPAADGAVVEVQMRHANFAFQRSPTAGSHTERR